MTWNDDIYQSIEHGWRRMPIAGPHSRLPDRVSRHLIFILLASAAWLPSRMRGADAAYGYMDRFSEAEAREPHVWAPSIAMPHDFVDGQWQGIIAASDGNTYFSFSSHSPHHNAQFYRYKPSAGEVEHLIDVGRWCGETESIGKWNTQGKIHSNIYEHKGKLYCTTTSAHSSFEHPYTGGHFLSYELRTGEFRDLGKVDFGGRGGLLSAVFDPVYGRLYGLHQHKTTLTYCDVDTGEIVILGPIEHGGMQCRNLIVDSHGVVYGSTQDAVIYRYNPAIDVMGCLLTRIPDDPALPDPEPGDGRAWKKTHWTPMVWDPATRWWYGIHGNDEYLFRFRTPPPERHIAEIEGLACLTFDPDRKDRYASLGLCLRGRTLYYCSYPVWKKQAHLMSYHIDSGTIVNHGKLVTNDGRRVSEIHSLVTGSDGKLHAAAMVWSIEGQDPAKPWSQRANCYVHSRFMTIDPETDFR